MSSQEYLQNQVIAAESQPKQRYSFLVKLIKRFLWPSFVRPFYFLLLEKLKNDLTPCFDGQNNNIEQGTKELLLLKFEGQNNNMGQLIKELLLLKSELAALKHRVIETSKPSNLLIATTKSGLLIVKPEEIISDFIIKTGAWDDHIVKLAQDVASTRRGAAIDVGAHLGSTMLPLSSIFDHVHSFEPNDFNFKILRANVVLNNLKNVSLYNNALYSHATHLSLGTEEQQEVVVALNDGDFNGMASQNLGAYLFTENGSGIFKHLTRTLDSYEFNSVAFIKIDAQGADGEVLMGALQTIRRCQPVIVFEWEENLSQNFNVSFGTIKNELSQLGYEISILKAHNEKQIDYVAYPIAIQKEL